MSSITSPETKLPIPKTWKAGVANEAWKVMICARDALEADDVIQRLVSILTDSGSDVDGGIAKIRAMSGDQIINGIMGYSHSCVESVRRALGPGK